MKLSFYAVVSVGLFLALTSAAQATIACSVTTNEAEAKSVPLYFEPADTSVIMREIPLDDLVFYPNDDFAPTQAEGWVWVRHDITQEDIWQSGLYGWVRVEELLDCG